MSIDLRYVTAALVALLCVSVPSHAQAPRQLLQDAKRIKCDFRVLTTGTWGADGTPQAEVRARSLSLGFSQIDTQDGIADVEGSFGAPHIIVQLSGGYLHFMQIGQSGFLYTTTVFDKISRPGRFKAVHTRHEYTETSIPGYTSRPEQYFGDCEVLQ